MNNLFLFDVDGVLCDRGMKVDPNFYNFFLNWTKDKTYYIVTGSNREKTISQIGEEILLNAEISFHCLGNDIWIKNNQVSVNKFDLEQNEIDFLMRMIKYSEFEHKTGNHIEKRLGSYNFSVLGKNATLEQRQQYVTYDNDIKERQRLIRKFMYHFPKYEAFIGGDVSIDICLRNANKSQVLNLLNLGNSVVHFFGDRCFEHGVDYPIVRYCTHTKHKCYQIDNGFNQTYEILQQL